MRTTGRVTAVVVVVLVGLGVGWVAGRLIDDPPPTSVPPIDLDEVAPGGATSTTVPPGGARVVPAPTWRSGQPVSGAPAPGPPDRLDRGAGRRGDAPGANG